MTKHEIETVMAYIDSLWVKHELGPAVMESIADRLGRIAINSEQAKAALAEFRFGSKWRTPDAGELIRRLQACRSGPSTTAGMGVMSTWKQRAFQMGLPASTTEEHAVAVWYWRIGRRAAGVYGHEWSVSAMITNYVCALVEELGWTPAEARAVSAQRWGFDKLADEFLNERYAA